MKSLNALITLLIFGLSPAAFADVAAVKIIAPADGATLDAMAQNKIAYEVSRGPDGDHIHLYIDDDEAALLRQLKGTYTLEGLSPGTHRLCIKLVNKNHTPIGVETCIKVKVE
jgi:hypothetical protein